MEEFGKEGNRRKKGMIEAVRELRETIKVIRRRFNQADHQNMIHYVF
jgi:hypothetical protein